MGALKPYQLAAIHVLVTETVANHQRCRLLRENDELVCHSCGHRWDVDDSDRECPRASVSPAQQILRELEHE